MTRFEIKIVTPHSSLSGNIKDIIIKTAKELGCTDVTWKQRRR
jgi:hypothetical protein